MGITMAGKLQPLQVERLVTPGKYTDPERTTQAKTFQESVEACIDKQWDGWSGKHRAQWPSSLKTYAYPTIGV